MKTDKKLVHFCYHNIKRIFKHTLTILICGSLIVSCTAASIRANAEPGQSENESSLSEAPAAETASSPADPDNGEDNDTSADQNKQYSAREYLDPFNNDMLYSAVIYDNSNGLPTSEANTISQTSEGFIWIGGYGGLVRFDGSVFEQISLEGIREVNSLYTDSRDRLWVGATNNGVAMIEKGKTSYWFDIDGAEVGTVLTFAEDSEGNVYIATKNGLAFVDKDLGINAVNDERVKDKYIADMKGSSDGLLYGVDDDGNVFTVKDGIIRQYGKSGLSQVRCLLPDPKNNGDVFVCSSDMLIHGAFDENEPDGMKIHGSVSLFFPYLEDIQYVDGRIWFCDRTIYMPAIPMIT